MRIRHVAGWRGGRLAIRGKSAAADISATAPNPHVGQPHQEPKAEGQHRSAVKSAVKGQFELAHIAVATRIVHVDAPTRLYIHLMQMMAG
jgi:hypothetical protein